MIYYLTHYNQRTYPFLINYLNKNGLSASWLHSPIHHGEYMNAFLGAWHAIKMQKKMIPSLRI